MDYQSYSHDQDQTESGAGFLLGLLSGVVLGVGVGMLLAPRTGSELRENIASSASDLQRRASEGISQVSNKVREATEQVTSRVKDTADRVKETAGAAADRVKETAGVAADRGRDALNRGKENWNEMRQESAGVGQPSSSTPGGGNYVS